MPLRISPSTVLWVCSSVQSLRDRERTNVRFSTVETMAVIFREKKNDGALYTP
jgi:hypothetical protein